MSDRPDPVRRRALTVLAGVGGATLAAGALPAARLALAPLALAGGADLWIPAGKLADLAEGKPHRVKLIADQRDGFAVAKDQPVGVVWLFRKGNDLRALSAVCPHLGCAVDLTPGGTAFVCPCHTSYFELDGAMTPGKPNKALRGMDPLPVRVSPAGVVEVQWKRFVLGKSSREVQG
jgi:menaquinol-cytochrome c reductase iron-sulfur subunit